MEMPKFATTRPVMTSAFFLGLAIFGGMYSAATIDSRHATTVSFSTSAVAHR